MKRVVHRFFAVLISLALIGCEIDASTNMAGISTPSDEISEKSITPTMTSQPKSTSLPVQEEQTASSSAINPLTGLPVKDADNLKLPPVLASISNFPVSARPQAGLSFSPIVFELFIGDGMTRNLAVFYGDYPEAALSSTEDADSLAEGVKEAVIGPIRSGRISYEKIRQLFSGFLVMASAMKSVSAELSDYVNVFGEDSDINNNMLAVTDLKELAQSSDAMMGEGALSGMSFDATPPENGLEAKSVWVYYSYLNQIFWRYDKLDGNYHRYQDNADGSTFIEATDRLNGEPLRYSNVVILFVKHEVVRNYVIDLDLLYRKREKALLFRDGKMYRIYWTTLSEEYEKTTGKLRPIRFIDSEGNPFPFKPGQTWIEVVPRGIRVWETIDSEVYSHLMAANAPGSGYWAVRFVDPT